MVTLHIATSRRLVAQWIVTVGTLRADRTARPVRILHSVRAAIRECWLVFMVPLILAACTEGTPTPGAAPPGGERPAQSGPVTTAQTAKIEDSVDARVNPPKDTLQGADHRNTRYGLIDVVQKSATEQQVRFQGHGIDVVDASVELGPVYQYGDADLLLVSHASGGNTCAETFILLVATTQGLDASESFGSCSPYIRVTERPGKLVVRIGDDAFVASPSGVKPIRISEANTEEASHELENPSEDLTSVLRPLVEADMQMYRWCGILEQAEKDTFVVALANPQYKFAAIASKPEITKGKQLRIGGQVCITGRYMSNAPYETVLGARRTMPLLAAYRISN